MESVQLKAISLKYSTLTSAFCFLFLNREYTVIGSSEQRQTYKNYFNTEYSEYRGLHARIEGITRQFTVLDTELKQLQQGTDKYKVRPLWPTDAYSLRFYLSCWCCYYCSNVHLKDSFVVNVLTITD